MKVKVLLPINQIQNNTQTSNIMSKWYQNGVDGIQVLDDNFVGHRTRSKLILTWLSKTTEVYQNRYVHVICNSWSVKTAKTLCISSRRFVRWNVIHFTKIRVLLLLLPVECRATWCSIFALFSSYSVVRLALTANGQKIPNAPCVI